MGAAWGHRASPRRGRTSPRAVPDTRAFPGHQGLNHDLTAAHETTRAGAAEQVTSRVQGWAKPGCGFEKVKSKEMKERGEHV